MSGDAKMQLLLDTLDNQLLALNAINRRASEKLAQLRAVRETVTGNRLSADAFTGKQDVAATAFGIAMKIRARGPMSARPVEIDVMALVLSNLLRDAFFDMAPDGEDAS